MGNNFVQKGASRLRKAPDAAVDPAVPAELQGGAAAKKAAAPAGAAKAGVPAKATAAPAPAAEPQGGTGFFVNRRVVTPQDFEGIASKKDQLRHIESLLEEIDAGHRHVESYVNLNKGILLEYAQANELHLEAGYANFATWAADRLSIDDTYVFELINDSRRIRLLEPLGAAITDLLIRASARKTVVDVLAAKGPEAAKQLVTTAAAKNSKRPRPTQAALQQTARELGFLTDRKELGNSESALPVPTHAAAKRIHAVSTSLLAKNATFTDADALRRAITAAPEDVTAQLDALADLLAQSAKGLAAARKKAQAAIDKKAADAKAAAERAEQRRLSREAAEKERAAKAAGEAAAEGAGTPGGNDVQVSLPGQAGEAEVPAATFSDASA
ncbi:hypothetical protein KV557_24620 [Kitasatospora aureofaciens]|uniref:hypothetical protein n=1 Tax=Kitasatospora aureofaciens TaxID=1894 RepID=UPI001C443BEB|nr:hypothetical protein [Kitasatospora aureofaciens]MBV6700249.1 hypothetical protein [Kitasatospora aureofaciens]